MITPLSKPFTYHIEYKNFRGTSMISGHFTTYEEAKADLLREINWLQREITSIDIVYYINIDNFPFALAKQYLDIHGMEIDS
jgi:hypothetical protein